MSVAQQSMYRLEFCTARANDRGSASIPVAKAPSIDLHQLLHLEHGASDFRAVRRCGIQQIDLIALARRNPNGRTDLGFQVSEAGAKRSPFPAQPVASGPISGRYT